MHTYSHKHTHLHTTTFRYARAHRLQARAYKRTMICQGICPCTSTHTDICIYIYRSLQIQGAHVYRPICMHTGKATHRHVHISTFIYKRRHAHMHPCTFAQTRIHTTWHILGRRMYMHTYLFKSAFMESHCKLSFKICSILSISGVIFTFWDMKENVWKLPAESVKNKGRAFVCVSTQAFSGVVSNSPQLFTHRIGIFLTVYIDALAEVKTRMRIL